MFAWLGFGGCVGFGGCGIRDFFAKCEAIPSRQDGFFKMGTGRYFSREADSNHVDVRMAEGQASCCGVNLAFATRGCFFPKMVRDGTFE